MTTYRVTWVIEVNADNPHKAAQKALEIQRDPNSIALCFEVGEQWWGHFAKKYWFDLLKEQHDDT